MGITPIGGDTEIQNLVTEFREVYGLAQKEENDQEVQEDTEISVGGGDVNADLKEPKSIDNDRRLGEIDHRDDLQSLKQHPHNLPNEHDKVERQKNPSLPTNADRSHQEDKLSQSQLPFEKPRIKCVEPEDSVTYCFLDNKDEIKTVQVVKGSNQPSMGIININAPLARALLRSEEGKEVEVRLPTGVRKARILSIEKAQ